MIEEHFSAKTVNFKALDAELREALGEAYNALMVADSMIRVFLNEVIPRATVQGILDAHDPAQLTAEQEAEADAVAALETTRASHAESLDLSQFTAESHAVQSLASYVGWLELEIRNLRGL